MNLLKLMEKLFIKCLLLRKVMEFILHITYYYTVPKNKLDQAEDYEIEEFDEFNEFELAIRHIQSKGANLSRFNVFKGNKPL